MPSPVMSAAGAAMKIVKKYANNWRLLYATQPAPPANATTSIESARRRHWGTRPSWSAQPAANGRGEQKRVEDEAIQDPQRIDTEMPPARQADGVPKARKTDLSGQSDESCFAVHDASAGTSVWKRNHSLPGVLSARTPAFPSGSGFWNFLGAGVFGFLINLPVVSFYEIGTQLTANHAHASMMGVYGMLSMGLLILLSSATYCGRRTGATSSLRSDSGASMAGWSGWFSPISFLSASCSSPM